MPKPVCTVSTLLYVFNDAEQILLQCRRRPPHQSQWSPPGGKCRIDQGESPHQCAAREAMEELCLSASADQFRLCGIITEQSLDEQGHWLMFLFEFQPRLKHLPPEHEEGHYQWFDTAELSHLDIPQTDREFIWPLFWRHRGGFFVTDCKTQSGKVINWQSLQSSPPPHIHPAEHD